MRFGLKHNGQLSCIEHCPEGEYVLHSEYATIQARVERLTKAGDVMATMLQFDEVAKDWNAAKEGKPQP